MNGSQGHCAGWNKSGRKRQTPYDLLYVKSKNKTHEKPKQACRGREQIHGARRPGWLRGSKGKRTKSGAPSHYTLE